MLATINVIVPVFGLIVFGYLFARTSLFGPAAVKGMTNFVFMLATPALLFRSLSKGVDFQTFDFNIFLAYYGAVAVIFGATFLLRRISSTASLAEVTLFSMGGIFSNTVLLGIPLIYTAFGDEGLLIIMMIIAVHSPVLLGGTTMLVALGESRADGLRAIRETVRAIFTNPIILAVLLGVFWAVFALPVPIIVDRFALLLGGAAAPCALFSLGATMAQYKVRGALTEPLIISILKLIVMPALVWLLAVFVFGLTPLAIAVTVISAALPTGSNVYVLAQRYDVYVARAASSIVISTGLSVVTVAVLIAIFLSQTG